MKSKKVEIVFLVIALFMGIAANTFPAYGDSAKALSYPTSSPTSYPGPAVIRYVKWNASGANNGSSWTNAYINLQSALSAASSGDEIWVAAGTYVPISSTERHHSFFLKNGVAIYGGFTGTETLRTQRNPSANVTILSGDIGAAGDSSDNSYHVVVGSNVDNTTVLDGFTITAGNANGDSSFNFDKGGGMYNSDGNPSLANLTFSSNSAISGGGMYNYYSSPSLLNVTFNANTSTYNGGGIYSDHSSLTLINALFDSNIATGTDISPSWGGGVMSMFSTFSIKNSTFTGNSAFEGGGINNNNSSTSDLENVTFFANSAQIGGAINNHALLNLTNTTISNNTGLSGFGGVFNAGTLNYTNSIIANSIGYDCYNANSFGIVNTNINNLVETYAASSNSCGEPTITADPQLSTLANNGGFTQTMALGAGSPAIDAGNDATCAATDQRGVTRPQGSHCDIGAFENDRAFIDVIINGTKMVDSPYALTMGASATTTYPLSNGPLEVKSTNSVPVIAAERVIFSVNGTATSYSELMGLPKTQVATSYLFPWYNNLQLNSQLRFGNVGSASTIVSVKIHGTTQATTYTLAPGASTTATFPVSDGPVEVFSDGQNIIAAERVIFSVNNTSTSYSELMGLPKTQLATSYLFPWYNNQQLNSQLRFGNVGSASTIVSVKIHGVTQATTYTLAPGASTTATFPVSDGPVEVFSDGQNIIAAERVIFSVNNIATSYSELMGLPQTQLATSYLFPWYNNQQLNSQLRFGNVGSASTIVSIKIHGTTQATTYTLAPGESTTATFSVSDGPVEVFSDGQNIIAAERVIFAVNNTSTSYSELMGLPQTQLATAYLFPWYNNLQLNSQLRFGVP